MPPFVLAADLVPWWFAAAFWAAFAVLVSVVVRDVRRAGGVRRTWRALNAAIERRGEAPPDDTVSGRRSGESGHPQ